MADEQSPNVETPTVINISNSNEGETNDNVSGENGGSNSGDEPASSIGDDDTPQSEQVVIAAIEAERDVALATIHGDVERERIAVEAERVETIHETNKEFEECREELARIAGIVENLAQQVNSLIQPPQLEVVEVTEELPIVPEPDLIQPSIAAPTAEQRMEDLEESAEERAEEIIPSRVRKFIAI